MLQEKFYGDINYGRCDGGQVSILGEGQRGTRAMATALFLLRPEDGKWKTAIGVHCQQGKGGVPKGVDLQSWIVVWKVQKLEECFQLL